MSLTDPVPEAHPEALAEDLDYQRQALDETSRTFALTIPQLPEALRTIVGNAYLLCRIADTIEDATALSTAEKRELGAAFVEVVAGERPAEDVAAAASRFTGSTLEAERDLVANTPRVIRVTHSFSGAEQATLLRCVRIMTEGMETFEEGRFAECLPDMAHLDEYCYHVAGVVGEMLTELFCLHAEPSAAQRDELHRLAVSFGQGLQMTNILKDVWEDKERGVCWLPQEVFSEFGCDLSQLEPGAAPPEGFEAGLDRLVAIAHGHLRNALEYVRFLPREHKGIRSFCLWALGMAILTLRNIHKRPGYRSGDDVKISRRKVKLVVAASQTARGSNKLCTMFFKLAGRGVPMERVEAKLRV